MITNNINTIGTQINDMLGSLGIQGGKIGAMVDSLAGNPLGVLENLRDAYYETATGQATTGFEREIAPSFSLPSPTKMMPALASFIGSSYFVPSVSVDQVDLAPNASDISLFGQFLSGDRAVAAQLEQALTRYPALRAQVEAKLGGTIVNDGKMDGKLTVMRFSSSMSSGAAAASALFPTASSAMGWLSNILNSTGVLGTSGLSSLIAQGLGNVVTGDEDSMYAGHSTAASKDADTYQSQCDAILADDSMSIEDKVVLFLMLIMNKMDQQIEDQMEHINELQQKKDDKGGNVFKSIGSFLGGAAGTIFGGGVGSALGSTAGSFLGGILDGDSSDSSDSSIDTETTKLSRMVEKRSQMFDMLRTIVDKYDETAKNMIQSMGR